MSVESDRVPETTIQAEDIDVVGPRKVERRCIDVSLRVGGDAFRMAGLARRQLREEADASVRRRGLGIGENRGEREDCDERDELSHGPPPGFCRACCLRPPRASVNLRHRSRRR